MKTRSQLSTAITSPTQIDLSRHAIIDASAGTGKTYTISQLIVRLVTGEANAASTPVCAPVPLERILVVTFTDKATGEMKERIRTAIEHACTAPMLSDEQRARLVDARDNFDTANISTIHSFCHSVLRDHAFENNRQFEYELSDDDTLARTLLHQQMRSEWPTRYGDDLETLLALADFGDPHHGQDKWLSTVTRLAREFRPASGQRLWPAPNDTFCMRTVVDAVLEPAAQLLDHLGLLDADAIERCDFYQQYQKLNFNANARNSRLRKVVAPILTALSHSDFAATLTAVMVHTDEAQFTRTTSHASRALVTQFQELFASLALKANDRFANILLYDESKWPLAHRNIDTVCPALPAIITCLDAIHNQLASIRPQMQANTAYQLAVALQAEKERRGWLTYDDMIGMVAQSVSRGSGALLDALRQRFDVALVDEFQDTNQQQWSIFKRLFVDGPQHRLIVVADPKQAIYGFRGADLNAYFNACRELESLGAAHTGNYALDVNWRSTPDLVTALNALFVDDHWFPPKDGLAYRPALSPPPDQQRTRVMSDSTRQPAVVVHPIDSELAPSQARRDWHRYIAHEIQRLLSSETPMLTFGTQSMSARALQANDICILVRSLSEAQQLERQLDAIGVAHSYYKKPGLYQSDETLQLATLIRAIARPNDHGAFRQALLTDFFAVSLNDISTYTNLPPEHPVNRLFAHWRDAAATRNWPFMFRSMLVDTGVLFRHRHSLNRDRHLTNMTQLMQDIHREATANNWDISGMWSAIDHRRHGTVRVSEVEDLHERESELPKVQILTIHKSKGLEFPVVFVAGGFTSGWRPSPYTKRHENDHVVYDLLMTNDVDDSDQQAEERRLYYVALTRAIVKLYLPYYRPQRRPNSGGAVATILYPVIDAARDQLDTAPQAPTPTESKIAESAQHCHVPKVGAPSLPTHTVNLWARHRTLTIDSYTKLKKRTHDTEHENRAFGDTDVRAPEGDGIAIGDIPNTDTDTGVVSESSASVLPVGARTGNVLHDIFERLDYQKAGASETAHELLTDDLANARIIARAMERHGLVHSNAAVMASQRTELAHIIWTALNVTLPGGIVLRNLAWSDRKHEVEFYFPYPNSRHEPALAHQRYAGFIKGYIDLVFRWRDRYYILDWKSDTLDNYSPPNLHRHMGVTHYDLQYRIYTLAVSRWLRQSGIEDALAGVFYIFLRGLLPGTEDGIAATLFDGNAPTTTYEKDVAQLIQSNGAPAGEKRQ